MKKTKIDHYTDKEALEFHSLNKPGKIEINSSKPMTTKRDLALAYSPGVAVPVQAIADDPETAYDYTSKGNLVAVISNGSAILGMGNLGALASKPVMEGKAVLFKRFADIDSIDLEIDSQDSDEIINSIKNFACSFGGINLEDIAAPDCFIIEEKLKEILDIPVFHDDQHGTAIITTAALINALDISGKSIKDIKVVVNGAGASAIACTNLFKNSGVPSENVIMLDRKGVVYRGRTEGMDQWKSAHAVETKKRTLEEAINGADVFLGLSAKGALKKELVKTMAKNPIIFACANPDPEITPEEIMEVRDDAIIATGRSDYPNQVNNLIGFPYIFRGALDVRATTINEEMKVAAANAIAKLAREDVPDEVVAAMGGDRPKYGKDYIIPSTFDPRLISVIPAAVAKAAMDSGVAKKPIKDFEAYRDQLKQRLDPSVTIMQGINSHIKKNQKRIVFADGEDENTLKAAIAFKNSKLGTPILIGKKNKIKERIKEIGYNENFDIEIINSEDTTKREKYVNFLFEKLQREKGLLERDCDRLVRNDRVIWASCMVACGDADGAVTGNTRRFGASFDKVTQVVDARPGEIMFGLNMVVAKGKTIFVGDTSVNEYPSSEELAEIAISSARVVKMFGFVPKVAFVSHSTFGQPLTSRTKHIKKAVEILKDKNVDFDFDGDMQPDVALNEEYKELYPFSSIVGNANILIMPGQHSAAISYKMMKSLGDTKVIGPLLIGLGQPIEIAPLRSSTSEIINLASVAAYSADVIDYKKS
ncbi:probable NADP-dependent malic enzyme [Candidatus Pelagibacter ubique HTCC1002]|uniref:Probable NADP-dependent malic enzyme n=1 Tax=Pelagibacter ubique (strain HTCC1002) TaxID=314261 RepID=Q1V1D2_PELU1|nr:NADP-dependent malic enzyme [Candidatus Pelagibacter ubique]EAS84946.1 probable NADP-dependent malic enzyme [Candidatus Pelagibacter ubique HTCC1002]MDC1207273.1 NADP-dependent malic enzyme [Candidatus Pelagibacter ubique]